MSVPKAVCTLACAATLLFGTSAVGADDVPAKSKPNEARIKGMKAAIADIEKNVLKQRHPPYPDAPQHIDYVAVLKKEYGVIAEVVDGMDKAQRDEMDGYNDVMRVEIEHRFGRGILDKLWKEAWKENEPKETEPKKSAERKPDGN